MCFLWHIRAKSVGEKQELFNPAVFCHSPGADSWMKSKETGQNPINGMLCARKFVMKAKICDNSDVLSWVEEVTLPHLHLVDALTPI